MNKVYIDSMGQLAKGCSFHTVCHMVACCALVLTLALLGAGVSYAAPTGQSADTAKPLSAIPKAPIKEPIMPLSPQEARVIIHKGTEAPYSGKYLDNKEAGTYYCRQCNAALYHSDTKFDSNCGWPSFDAEIPGAVVRVPDADGKRVEIVCANCKGHLGHVFEGEGFTAKNTRHCVNSVSMVFVPATQAAGQVGGATGATETAKVHSSAPTALPATEARAIFAGGCFWGVEDAFEKLDGVKAVVSGYTGGTLANPTYNQVTTGRTGHAEAVEVLYDPQKVSYESLARLFFEIHDPTQMNRQGPDVGTQYRSAVYYSTEAEKTTVEGLITKLKAKGWDVVTEIAPASVFYPAEDYHQDYTRRTGRGGCHFKVARFEQSPTGR